jgi:PAS domain S-box-containing protein
MTKSMPEEKVEKINNMLAQCQVNEQELKASFQLERAKDEAILDSIGEGVIATDEYGKIVHINRQIELMFRMDRKEAIGKTFYDLFMIEDEQGGPIPESCHPMAIALSAGEEVVNSNYYYYSENVSRFPAALTIAPVFVNEKFVGTVTVIRNISKEKEVDRAKSEFVSLASHQLRTPLTAIKLFVEMLETESLGPLSPDQKEIMNHINQSNEKMIHLVDTLLNVSRMETGKIKTEIEKLNIKEFIETVINDSEPFVLLNRLSIKFVSPDEKDMEVCTDPTLIRQVITNLITNAIQYSYKDSVPITVTLEKTKKEFICSVRNAGIGIPKEAQAKIFERFYRADNAIKAKTEGNGLGLYMCKMFMEELGGQIWVDSEPNKGATFSVSLPRVCK